MPMSLLRLTRMSLKNCAPNCVPWVRKEIGPIATPEVIQFADGLPKTRSGKIMRRILRKIASGETSEFGDTSTLSDPGVITDLIDGRLELTGR